VCSKTISTLTQCAPKSFLSLTQCTPKPFPSLTQCTPKPFPSLTQCTSKPFPLLTQCTPKPFPSLTQSNSNWKLLETQCNPYAFDISVSTLHVLSDVLENQMKFPFCCVYAKTFSPYNNSFRLSMSQLTTPFTTISVQCPYRIIIIAGIFRDSV